MTEPQIHLFKDDGIIPNQLTLPLLYYRYAVELNGTDNAAVFERLFYNITERAAGGMEFMCLPSLSRRGSRGAGGLQWYRTNSFGW